MSNSLLITSTGDLYFRFKSVMGVKFFINFKNINFIHESEEGNAIICFDNTQIEAKYKYCNLMKYIEKAFNTLNPEPKEGT